MDYVQRLEIRGREVILTWVGQIAANPARVYALAFTATQDMLLVSGGPDDPDRWLPGGGVETGENPEQALRRELLEEADATIEALSELGSQRVDSPDGGREYHRFYWCRVTLAVQGPTRLESTLRHLVAPADFLATLQWGHVDPKATMLLESALEAERTYRA